MSIETVSAASSERTPPHPTERLQRIGDGIVDLARFQFEAAQKAGTLDPTKTVFDPQNGEILYQPTGALKEQIDQKNRDIDTINTAIDFGNAMDREAAAAASSERTPPHPTERLQRIGDGIVDLARFQFEAAQKAGTLDPTKTVFDPQNGEILYQPTGALKEQIDQKNRDIDTINTAIDFGNAMDREAAAAAAAAPEQSETE